MECVFLLLSVLLSSSLGQTQSPPSGFNNSDIQDIRLQNSSYGDHAGRLEVMYNDTWGTICDRYYWSFNDAQVACRMLGFSRTLCSVRRSQFGSAELGVPIWMDNLQCNGRELALDQCSFSGWGENRCSHSDDVGVICYEDGLLEVVENISFVDSTRKTFTITIPAIRSFPPGTAGIQYRIRARTISSTYYYNRILRVSLLNAADSFNYTFSGLTPDTQYIVDVRLEVRYRECYGYLQGNYSNAVNLTTSNTVPPSNIPVRLVPPEAGLDFMGRVEVFHDNEWGTVCDDVFASREATVICGMLNYTRAACHVTRARLGRGTGRIWLDNVSCRNSPDILDDCQFNPWGQHNCAHSDDVGVVCIPDDYPDKIENVTITEATPSSVTLSWKPFNFPGRTSLTRYSIGYRQESRTYESRVYTRSSAVTSYTLLNLQFLSSYSFTVRAEIRFSSCYRTLTGVPSDPVTAVLMETAPSNPPTSFHVTVLSCNTIRAEWELPSANRNGIIRGFKVFVQPSVGGDELVFNVTGNGTTELIIEDLTPSTSYVVSVLAYTVGDGPRSIHLTAMTSQENICHRDIINFFGINGDDLNRATRFTYQRDIHILCGTSAPGVQLDWFFSNGTKVGINNRNIREGHFPNGTVSLQIASDRRLSTCDSGVYTCRGNHSETERAEEKTFTLIINQSPPTPSKPGLLAFNDTTVTISWDENICTGGHILQSFNVRYSNNIFYRWRTYRYINGIDKNQRNLTIADLTPSTTYYISVQAVSTENAISSYTAQQIFTTLTAAPPPPQAVRVELITPVILTVSWSKPSISSGVVVFYTVYAFPLATKPSPPARNKRQAENNALGMISQNFSASVTTGNVTVHEQSVTYHVQVSATIRGTTGIFRESQLSAIDTSNTIFVPLPELPVPQNVEVARTTNSSVSLSWDRPPPPRDEISEFQVFYSGVVDGVSPSGTLVRFEHEGSTSTPDRRITVQPLTPGTNYLFKVSAITERGPGREVNIEAQTLRARSSFERYVYFQIRFGPVLSCTDFHSQDIEIKRNLVKGQLISQLSRLCNCDISSDNIQDSVFSCGQLNHLILYRGRLLGSDEYSALGLWELMQSWVNTNQAFLTVDSFRMQVDPTCTARLDTINAPDCLLGDTTPISPTSTAKATEPTSSTSTAKATEPKISAPIVSAVRSAEIGGIAIGVVIILLLIALLLIIAMVILYKTRKGTVRNGNSKLSDEDRTPFADMEPSTHESSLFEEKMKD